MIRCGVLGCPNIAPEKPDKKAVHIVRLPSVGGPADDVGLAKFPRGMDLPVCDSCFSIFQRSERRAVAS